MNARDRRALRLGGALVLAAFLGLRGVPWIWRHARTAVDGLHARAELLARTQAEVRGARALEDSGAVVRARFLALAPRILAGRAAAAAAADLAGRLTVAAERHRVRLERSDALPDSTARGALRRVSVRATLEGDTRGTFGVLGALVADSVVLAVDELRIVAPEPGSATTAPEVVRTEVTVRGWYLSREDSR